MSFTPPISSPHHTRRLRFAVIFAICTALVIGLTIALGGASTPFLAGAVFAYLAIPIVDWLESLGCRKALGAFVVTALFCGAFIALMFILIPLIAEQVTSFLRAWPDMIAAAKARLVTFLDDEVPGISRSDLLVEDLSMTSLIETTEEPANQAVNLVFSAVDMVLFTLLTPFVCFFLLRDGRHALETLKSAFPQRQRPTVNFLLGEVHNKLSGLVRGQSLVILTQAVIHASGLALIGLNNAILLGILTGLSAIVPVAGNLLMFGIALVTAFTQFNDILPIILVCLLYGFSQVLETAVLSPYFIGRNVRTHPLWILFGLLVGGSLLGAAGVILALPIVVIADVFVSFIVEERKKAEASQSIITDATELSAEASNMSDTA